MSSPASEESEGPRDLRAELFEALSSHFTAALEADQSIPLRAREALVELLNFEAPTASDILNAAWKREEDEQEKESYND